MKQKLFIILALIFLPVLLIGLNAASYVQKEKVPDSEAQPNRSTYNPGATGTRALYDLLAATGAKVRRWQEPFPAAVGEDQFSTYVIVGPLRRKFEENEFERINNWISGGGTLIVIDREPPAQLIGTTAYWSISQNGSTEPVFLIDPSDQKQMTAGTEAVKPVQPSVLTAQINAVQPSKFASSITLTKIPEATEPGFGAGEDPPAEDTETGEPPPPAAGDGRIGTGDPEVDEMFQTPEATPLEPAITPPPHLKGDETYDVSATAPVIHLANREKNLLADFPFGAGRVIFLSDPYIVANGGIRLVDNAPLAVNLVDSGNGIIAFDEYHHGYGSNDNLLIEYFAGTPVIPIFLQILLIAGLVFISQSRRFARPLPAAEANRLSKLEYVSAMAQLQERTKAFDLAIENIYREFRRRVSRMVGIDNHTAKREDIAEKIAERTVYTKEEIADLMFQCEDIMHGEPAKKKRIVELIRRLREVEDALGLRRGKKREDK
jgi:hypothetical protein